MYLRCCDVRPALANCDSCTLLQCSIVEGHGPDEADLVIVGEAPGDTEERRGEPFVGVSGRLLNQVLQVAGIDRSRCYLTNAVLGRPRPHRAPTIQEVHACRERLLAEVQRHNPKVVLALGQIAVRALCGKSGAMKGERGFTREWNGTKLVASWHPAGVLRKPRLYPELEQDARLVAQLLGIRPAPPVDVEVKESIDFEVLRTPAHLGAWLSDHPRLLSTDVETASDGHLVSMALAALDGGVAAVAREAVLRPEIARVWNREMAGGRALLGHNFKSDIRRMWNGGLSARVDEDTMLAEYAGDMRIGGHTLKEMAETLLQAPKWDRDVKPYLSHMEDCPDEILYPYNCADSYWTLHLDRYEKQAPKFDQDARRAYYDLLIPASNVLARMEETGCCIDTTLLDELEVRMSGEVDERIADLRTIAGPKYNPNSQPQNVRVLFDQLGLPRPDNSSTDKTVLEALSAMHPFPKALLEYRRTERFLSTYVRSIRSHLASDGRIRSNFNLHTTVTGRLSSSNPINFQNIPTRRSKDIRNLFIASPGCTLVSVDLSQAELRTLAALCHDPALLEAIHAGIDLHLQMASMIFKKPVESVTPEERTASKNCQFAILYGASPGKVTEMTGLPLRQAMELLDRWFAAFPVAAAWIKQTEAHILEHREVRTIFGRVRRWEFIPDGYSQRAEVLREGVNTCVQSPAADILTKGLIKLGNAVDWTDTKLLLSVHDQVIAETRSDPVGLGRWMRDTIVSQSPFDVPFDAEIKIGDRWGSLKTVA